MSDMLVDELISFDPSAPGVAPGWVYAQCEACGAYRVAPQPAATDWAEQHVTRHRGGRHCHWAAPYVPLVADPGDYAGRHRSHTDWYWTLTGRPRGQVWKSPIGWARIIAPCVGQTVDDGRYIGRVERMTRDHTGQLVPR
ncbi:MAG: hypothetical protein PGN37_20480 [Mycobacterium kyogaense]|uniref:hypothetical protein n=1 Tax=Mycobacterium kyogaense TaxID=2212479 RepID=UPI002FF6BC5E